MFAVLSGSAFCHVSADGMCVTDGVGDHAANEHCVMMAAQPLFALASTGQFGTYFFTETYFDYVTIGGNRYSGTSGPENVNLAAGETFSWDSDVSVNCACTPPHPHNPHCNP